MSREHVSKKENILIILCFAVYFVSYLTRVNYAASISTIIGDLSLTKETASMALTGSFVTYGVGQILCGVVGDRINPRYFICFGLVGAAICNTIVYFSSSIWLITVIWCFNGLFQAMIWPPLFRTMSENLGELAFQRACVVVSVACLVATVFIYLILVPLCIRYFHWRLAFLVPALVGFGMAVLWFFALRAYKGDRLKEIEEAAKDQPAPDKKTTAVAIRKAMFSAGVPLIMLGIVVQGAMRDGVNAWMPTFIAETYHWENASSVMSTAILPVFSILCVLLASKVLSRIRNEQIASLLFWALSTVASVILFFGFSVSGILAIATMAAINGAAHSVNHLESRVPNRFVRFHRVSTVSGLLNSCTYVGSALSTYGFALLSERFGWKATILSWVALSVLGLIITFISMKPYKHFLKEEENLR